LPKLRLLGNQILQRNAACA